MTLADWSKVVLLALIWGGSFYFVEIALNYTAPMTIVFYRVALAAFTLWAYCIWKGERFPSSAGLWLAFLMMGLLNNVIPFTLITWGQTQITAGLASILNATTPLFAVAISHYWPDGEQATLNKIFGIVVGIVGMAVLIGPSLGDASGTLWGKLALLCSSISYAFAANYGRKLLKQVSPIVAAAGMLTSSSLVMLPIVLLLETPFAPLPVNAWLALIGIAVLCSAIAYLLYFRILQTAGPTNLVLVTFLIPISAIALGLLFLGETIAPYQIGGLVLILAGLACVDGRILSWRRPAA